MGNHARPIDAINLSSDDELGYQQLPRGWSLVDTFEERAMVCGIELRLAGFAAQHADQQKLATGSSASWTKDPRLLAHYELLERIAIVEAVDAPAEKIWPLLEAKVFQPIGHIKSSMLFPTSSSPLLWQPARSNAVAMGSSLEQAVNHAVAEAVERHLILASWYGAGKPQLLSRLWPKGLETLASRYRIENYSLGHETIAALGKTIEVVATFLWPLSPEDHLIYGFGAASEIHAAYEKSCREAIQRLGFLVDQEQSTAEPEFSPRPDFHQDYFLHPERRHLLSAWLGGSFFKQDFYERLKPVQDLALVNLTPENFGDKVVIKAISPQFLPLIFGRYKPQLFPEISEEQVIHPIV